MKNTDTSKLAMNMASNIFMNSTTKFMKVGQSSVFEMTPEKKMSSAFKEISQIPINSNNVLAINKIERKSEQNIVFPGKNVRISQDVNVSNNDQRCISPKGNTHSPTKVINPLLSLQENKALNLTANIYMNSTTKYVKGLFSPREEIHQKSNKKDSHVNHFTQINGNNQVSPSSKLQVKSSSKSILKKQENNLTVQDKAYNLAANQFMNSTTRYEVGININQKQLDKIQRQNAVKVNFSPPKATQKHQGKEKQEISTHPIEKIGRIQRKTQHYTPDHIVRPQTQRLNNKSGTETEGNVNKMQRKIEKNARQLKFLEKKEQNKQELIIEAPIIQPTSKTTQPMVAPVNKVVAKIEQKIKTPQNQVNKIQQNKETSIRNQRMNNLLANPAPSEAIQQMKNPIKNQKLKSISPKTVVETEKIDHYKPAALDGVQALKKIVIGNKSQIIIKDNDSNKSISRQTITLIPDQSILVKGSILEYSKKTSPVVSPKKSYEDKSLITIQSYTKINTSTISIQNAIRTEQTQDLQPLKSERPGKYNPKINQKNKQITENKIKSQPQPQIKPQPQSQPQAQIKLQAQINTQIQTIHTKNEENNKINKLQNKPEIVEVIENKQPLESKKNQSRLPYARNNKNTTQEKPQFSLRKQQNVEVLKKVPFERQNNLILPSEQNKKQTSKSIPTENIVKQTSPRNLKSIGEQSPQEKAMNLTGNQYMNSTIRYNSKINSQKSSIQKIQKVEIKRTETTKIQERLSSKNQIKIIENQGVKLSSNKTNISESKETEVKRTSPLAKQEIQPKKIYSGIKQQAFNTTNPKDIVNNQDKAKYIVNNQDKAKDIVSNQDKAKDIVSNQDKAKDIANNQDKLNNFDDKKLHGASPHRLKNIQKPQEKQDPVKISLQKPFKRLPNQHIQIKQLKSAPEKKIQTKSKSQLISIPYKKPEAKKVDNTNVSIEKQNYSIAIGLKPQNNIKNQTKISPLPFQIKQQLKQIPYKKQETRLRSVETQKTEEKKQISEQKITYHGRNFEKNQKAQQKISPGPIEKLKSTQYKKPQPRSHILEIQKIDKKNQLQQKQKNHISNQKRPQNQKKQQEIDAKLITTQIIETVQKTTADKLKEDINLKKTSIIFFILSRLSINKAKEVFIILKQIKAKNHSLEAHILSFSVEKIYSIKLNNIYNQVFNVLKRKALSFENIKGKSINLKQNNSKTISFNILQYFFRNQLRKTFNNLNQNQKLFQHKKRGLFILNELYRRKYNRYFLEMKENINYFSKNKKNELENLCNIMKNYFNPKIHVAFQKIKHFAINQNKKQKINSTINSSITLPNSRGIKTQKQSINLSEKQINIENVNQKLNRQIENIERKINQKNKNKEIQKNKLNRKTQELRKNGEKIYHEVDDKKRKNNELKKLVDNFQETQNLYIQNSLGEDEEKISLLTEIYASIFANKNQQINKEQLIRTYNLQKASLSNNLDTEWNLLHENIKLKKEISCYEGSSERQNRARHHLMQEQHLISKLTKSYVRERYLWEWVKITAGRV